MTEAANLNFETTGERINYILLNAVSDSTLARQTVTLIEESWFDQESESHYALILRGIKDILGSHSKQFDFPSLSIAISSIWGRELQFEEEDYQKAVDLINQLAPIAEGYTPDPIQAVTELRNFVEERGILEGILGNLSTTEASKAIKMVQKAYEKVNSVRASTMPDTGDDDYFAPENIARIQRIKMVPTNVKAVDSLFGGGPAEGDSIGILGFPAGGKTQLGVQLVCETAKRNRHTAYFMYENDPEAGGLNTRCKGYSAEVPASVFHDASKYDKEIPKHYQDAMIREAKAWMHEFLHVKNCAGPGLGLDGMETIRNYLAKMEKDGKHISLFVIDQLIPMVTKYMTSAGLDEKDRRVVMQSFMMDLTAIADEFRTVAIMLHQIDNASKKGLIVSKPTQGLAAEDKSFDNWVIHSLVLGRKDQFNRGFLSLVKSRRRDEQHIVVQHKPDQWRIDYDSRVQYQVDKGVDAFVTQTDGLNT